MPKKASDVEQVKVRMRGDQKRKLEREAERNGLTLNAEILRRLDLSFVMFGKNLGLYKAIEGAISLAEAETGKSWGQDATTCLLAIKTMRTSLQAFAEDPARANDMLKHIVAALPDEAAVASATEQIKTTRLKKIVSELTAEDRAGINEIDATLLKTVEKRIKGER